MKNTTKLAFITILLVFILGLVGFKYNSGLHPVKAHYNNEILKKETKNNTNYIVVWDKNSGYTIVYYLTKKEWSSLKVGDIY